MTQFMESFFDKPTTNFKLWSKNVNQINLTEKDIVFKGQMLKLSTKTGKLKDRLFILTSSQLLYLKSAREPRLRGVMQTEWVRCEYIEEISENRKRNCIRFIKNMKYCDFWVDKETDFKLWKSHLSKVLIQSDFHGKFNAIKMIGKGSFARVYLVEEKETGIKYAVKAFSKECLLSQAKGRDSLLNEINIMRKLEHPNIMKLEEIHESKNSVYLILELLEGGELFSHIADKKQISVNDICRIMKCLLEALVYLSDKGIMHRDLKPENMILDKKGDLGESVLKLVDFGLSTQCDVPEYLFKRCGTPGYVAPEVINAASNENVHYSTKCDVFSAGVIFYIMLTGKTPFEGHTFQEVLAQNRACKIDFKNQKLRKSAHVLDLVQKMLENNPNGRISARDALNHEFFKVYDLSRGVDYETEEEKLSLNYSQIKKVKNGVNNLEAIDSFVIREGIINGEINTIDETNSQAGFLSVKTMGRKEENNGRRKKTSILKEHLLKE